MKSIRVFLLLLLTLGALVAACGKSETPEPTPLPTIQVAATATVPAPTNTPVPPTATSPPPPPTETPDPLADFASYASEFQGVSLKLPESWEIEDEGDVLALVSDPAIFEMETFSEGGAMIVVGDAAMSVLRLQAILDIFVGASGSVLQDAIVVSEPVGLEINGQDALQATYTGVLEGKPVKAKVTAIHGDDSVVVAIAVSPPEGDAVEEAIMDLIVSSIVVSVPVKPIAESAIAYGETVSGEVAANGSATWIFEAEDGDGVNVIVEPQSDDFDAVVDVLDESGESALPGGAVDSSFGREETGVVVLAAGQYSIVVTGFADSSGPFEMTLQAIAGGSAGALPLAPGDILDGSLGANAPQGYAFTAFAGESLTFEVAPDDDLDVVLAIVDSSGEEIVSMDASFGDEELVFDPPSDGSYTLLVESYDGSPGTYTVSMSAGGPADLSEIAIPLGAGDALAGSLATNTPQAYLFSALAGETLTLIVSPDGELDVVLTVYSSAGREIESLDASYGEEQLVFDPPVNGDYVLLVESYDGSPGTYVVSIEIGGTVSIGTESFDIPPIPETGVLLAETATVGDDEVAVYTLTTLKYRPVTIYVEPLEGFDAVVEIYDSKGSLMQSQDFLYDVEEVLFVPPFEDDYTIEVSGYGGVGGSFNITIFRGGLGGVGVTGSVVEAFDEIVEPDDAHSFPFTSLGGEAVLAVVDPDNFDLYIEVVDDDTDEVIRAVDATYGYERLLFLPPAEGGNYRFVVRGFEGGTGLYTISLLGGADTAFELAPDDIIYGTLGEEAFLLYTYSGLAGETVAVTVDPDDDLDAVISIEPFEGEPYATADENFEGFRETATYTFTEDELIWIVVRGFDGDVGSFTMTITLQ